MGTMGNEDLCRYVFKVSKEIKDDEKRFHYVQNEINSLEKCMDDGPTKRATIKSLVNWAIKEFTSIEKYKYDKRMLNLWRLMGKYSENMGMDGVLENLHRVGFFKGCPEFYLMWAEHWASQGKRENFNKTIQICEQNCRMSPFEVKELFKPLLVKYFDVESSPDGKTVDLMRMLAPRPEDVRPELTLFHWDRTTVASDPKHRERRSQAATVQANDDGLEESGHGQPGGSMPAPRTNREDFSVFKDPTTIVRPVPAAAESVAPPPTHRDDFSVFKDPTSIIQPPPVNREDFSVFKDPTTIIQPAKPRPAKKQQIPEEPRQQRKQQEPAEQNDVEMACATPKEKYGARRQSFFPPLDDVTMAGSHGKFSCDMFTSTPRRSVMPGPFEPVDDPADATELSPPAKPVENQNNKKQQPEKKDGGERQMFFSDLDDVTVAGSHGKFASDMFTSTPRRSINPGAFEPLLFDDFSPHRNQEQLLFDDLGQSMMTDKREGGGGGLFGAGTSSNMANAGGSKLQKRLSLLANEAPQQQQVRPVNPMVEAFEKAKKAARNTPMELVRTLPQLKIGSTIEEVSEEKENSTATATNTAHSTEAFSSPFRKKTRMAEHVSNCAEPQAEEVGQKEEKEEKMPQEEQQVDPNESTHTGIVVEKIKAGTVNPWDEQMRKRVLAGSPPMVECHEFPTEKCPRVEQNRTIHLGGEQFQVDKLLGQGGFARVYKAKSLDHNQLYAVKYEAPPCPWEVYICSTLRRRLPPAFLDWVMQVRDAYVFTNASAIIYEYYPHGTLLDLGNMYKKNATEMGGLLATYFGIQLGRILEQVHAANIIHGDVKPDNVVLTVGWLDERKPLDQLLAQGTLKLIDWGRSIDMDYFPPGQQFIGRAGTANFDCVEMISGLPWNFQTDFYGFVASIYVLLRGEYLVTFKYGDKIIPTKVLKRRMALYDLWLSLFDQFLNIPNCNQLPKWGEVNRGMEERLKTVVATELGLDWRKAVERFNGYMKERQQLAN